MAIILIAIGALLLSILWIFYFIRRMNRAGFNMLPCRVCGRSVLVPVEKPEAVTNAEKIFQGEAVPVVICWDCQA